MAFCEYYERTGLFGEMHHMGLNSDRYKYIAFTNMPALHAFHVQNLECTKMEKYPPWNLKNDFEMPARQGTSTQIQVGMSGHRTPLLLLSGHQTRPQATRIVLKPP